MRRVITWIGEFVYDVLLAAMLTLALIAILGRDAPTADPGGYRETTVKVIQNNG